MLDGVRPEPASAAAGATAAAPRSSSSGLSLVDIEALVDPFSPGSTLEPRLKGFHRRGLKWLL
jgi:hypothetical protein